MPTIGDFDATPGSRGGGHGSGCYAQQDDGGLRVDHAEG